MFFFSLLSSGVVPTFRSFYSTGFLVCSIQPLLYYCWIIYLVSQRVPLCCFSFTDISMASYQDSSQGSVLSSGHIHPSGQYSSTVDPDKISDIKFWELSGKGRCRGRGLVNPPHLAIYCFNPKSFIGSPLNISFVRLPITAALKAIL